MLSNKMLLSFQNFYENLHIVTCYRTQKQNLSHPHGQERLKT